MPRLLEPTLILSSISQASKRWIGRQIRSPSNQVWQWQARGFLVQTQPRSFSTFDPDSRLTSSSIHTVDTGHKTLAHMWSARTPTSQMFAMSRVPVSNAAFNDARTTFKPLARGPCLTNLYIRMRRDMARACVSCVTSSYI